MDNRRGKPELSVTFCELLIVASILFFYVQSEATYSSLLIFTVANGVAFGNIVLPLPFRLSVGFTFTSVAMTGLAVTLRQDADMTTSAFILLNLTTICTFMLFSTYRGERSERKTYLFNLRERFRADLLAEKNEQLRNLSEIDGLTGVCNRRYFDEALDRLWHDGMRKAEPLALIIVDIDHFKKLNDTFGHQEGDRCLKAVARCLHAHLMPNATLARYGGEEFVVLLPGVNALYARSCAEVLRLAVSSLELASDDGSPIATTISIGTSAVVPTSALQSSGLVVEADQALYRAKANGRNRVESAISRVQGTAVISVAPQLSVNGCSGLATAASPAI